MKKNSLIPAMIGVLVVLTVFLAVATFATIQFSRKARRLQSELTGINYTKLNVQALIQETAAYAQTNRSIEPILQSIGLRLAPPTAAPKTPTR